jgi:Glycosyl hydrolases family 25
VTIFGPDISSYQHGVNVRALALSFVLMKCTEGTSYADADYPGWLAQARASGKLVVAYHFVIAGEDPDAQAAWIAAHIIDRSLPLMLDVETEGASKPTLPQVLALADRCAARGLRPKLAYLPRWFWSEIGSPDLSPLASRGIGVVSSAYPGGASYPGDSGPGWSPYGGVTPMLWQFTDAAVEGGQRVGDMNAFRGSVAVLAAFLGSSSTPQGGSSMGTISPAIGQQWPEIAAGFPANQPFDNDTALIWADAGARAAALYSKQALDAVNALAQRIGQPAAVDVNALAAAIAPLLQAATSPSADDVANAVVAHLAAQFAKG